MATGPQLAFDVEVEGMTCASCVRRVESAITKVPGVESATVNLATERARVVTTGEVTLKQIGAAIERAGYGYRPPTPAITPRVNTGTPAAVPEAVAPAKELDELRNKGLVSVAVGLALMALMFAPLQLDMTLLAPLLLVVATIIQVWAGGRFYRAAWRAARHGSTTMDTLVAIGTGTAFAYSAFVTLWPTLAARIGLPLELYYESAILIVGLVLVGRWLEARARARTGAAVKALAGIQPRTATVIRNDAEVELPIGELRVGDLVRVRAAERVPADGTVIAGSASVDESMVTGESLPVAKQPGSTVIGGTQNGAGGFLLKVERLGAETTLAQIIRLVEEAQGSRAPAQRLADTVSAYFVPAILVIAALTFAVWMLVGPEPRLGAALRTAISVLIVACPCALGLATPAAITVATGRGAELGILFRSAETLERTRQIQVMLVDKTGTVTSGRPAVCGVRAVAGNDEEVLSLAAGAERAAEHPIAAALLRRVEEQGIPAAGVTATEMVAGQGVVGTLDGEQVLVGSRRLLERMGVAVDGLGSGGATAVYVARGGEALGVISLADEIRPESREAVDALRDLGVEVHLVTGDSAGPANQVAAELGIGHVHAGMLPREKAALVSQLREQGRVVAMVGDGINDAPALAAADVGFAVGTGTDVALAASDITLIGSDLRAVVTAIGLSRETVVTIRQGLFWAFAYNVLLIPVATGLLFPLVRVVLSPILAAAAMAMSSVSVVTNAPRLRGIRPPSSAAEVRHPARGAGLRAYAYLAGIAIVAVLVGSVVTVVLQRRAVDPGTVSATQAGLAAPLSHGPAAAGTPVRLDYSLSATSDRQPFDRIVASHDHLMHLVIVSRDLGSFQHVHPEPTSKPGHYAVDVDFPSGGQYLLFDEFITDRGRDVLLRDTVEVAGTPDPAAPLAPDTAPKLVDGYQISLEGAGNLLWGRPGQMTFVVTRRGLPFYGLRQYLGADAHVSIVSGDRRYFLHTHGAAPGAGQMTMEMGGPAMAGGLAMAQTHTHSGEVGPRIQIEPAFPAAGLYKVWAQFEAPDRQVLTVAFVVSVH